MSKAGTANERNRVGRWRVLSFVCSAFLIAAAQLSAQTSDKGAALDLLRQLSSSFEGLVKRVSPSVVQVLATGYGALEESGRSEAGLVIARQRAIGSGVVVDPEGYVVTNAHVVNGARRVEVLLPSSPTDESPIRLLATPGRSVEARMVGVAREIDLALLKIDAHGLPALPIAKYGKLRQGEMVFAFGSPEGLRNSVTMGVSSAVARQPDPDSPMVFIQTDAPINPGNSGGPLVNVDGELVGINTFILSQSGGNEGLGFAIPSAAVDVTYKQLRKYGHIHRGEIGVAVQTITPALAQGLGLSRNTGVIVSDVLPGGPADSAGLKIQDIILTLDGRPMDILPMFAFAMLTRSAGDQVRMEVLRGSEKLTLEVSVAEQPHEVDRLADRVDPDKNLVRRLGIPGVDVDPKIAGMLPGLREPSGVIVAARAADSGGAESSLSTGDVIHKLNGSPVSGLESLRSTLDRLKPGGPMVLQLERDGRLTYVVIQPD